MKSIYARLFALASDEFGVEETKLSADTHLVNDLGADSLDTVEFVMDVEDEFDISIPEDIAETMNTIKSIALFIKSKLPELQLGDPIFHARTDTETVLTDHANTATVLASTPGLHSITSQERTGRSTSQPTLQQPIQPIKRDSTLTPHQREALFKRVPGDVVQFVCNAIRRQSKVQVSDIRRIIEAGGGTLEELGLSSDQMPLFWTHLFEGIYASSVKSSFTPD